MTEKPDFDGRRRIEQFVREGKKEMKSAKRWTVKWDETEIPDGDYVRASDFDEAVRILRWIRTRLLEINGPEVCNSDAELIATIECALGSQSDLCWGCPPVGYPTDKTRCTPCPRRSQSDVSPHAHAGSLTLDRGETCIKCGKDMHDPIHSSQSYSGEK